MAKVYVIVPVHNRRGLTRKFVECLTAQTFNDYQLIVVDDGSTDRTAEMVRERIPSAVVLRGTGKWWWAGSLQRGLEWLEANAVSDDSLVLFINDDVEFAPEYLERAVRVMADKRGALVLSRVRAPNGRGVLETGINADLRRLRFRVADTPASINCLPTRGLFAHCGDLRRIGRFHTTLLPHYLSDYEYTIRAHKKGLRCETSAELVLVANDGTTGYHTIEDHDLPTILRKYFSKKSPANPLHWSAFIMLTVSPIWILPNLARVWVGAIKSLARTFADNRPRADRKPA
jgi:GT2 family glycosyltransferase